MQGASRYIFLFLFSLSCISLLSQPDSSMIRIELYHKHLVSSLLITPVSGVHHTTPGPAGIELEAEKQYYLSVYKDKLLIGSPDEPGSLFDSLEITAGSEDAVLALRPVSPYLPGRKFNGSISIKALNGFLAIINTVDLNSYLAGVAEAEAGPNAPAEFYKAQIILCRTYAIRNLMRHGETGANLCDEVHCQAYHGMPVWNEGLLISAVETSGTILVDTDSVPVFAAYHSNSGGYTRNSGDIWLKDLPYLRAKKDEFSLEGRHATWELTAGFGEWISYLEKKNFRLPAVVSGREIEYFSSVPRQYYPLRNDSVSFVEIRVDWEFPSDFFDIQFTGGSFRFTGRGYGHGLGMSQEGAMNMARQGHNYEGILDFYFKGTSILDYRVSKEW